MAKTGKKIAVITGASSGMGRKFCEILDKNGWEIRNLAVNIRKEKKKKPQRLRKLQEKQKSLHRVKEEALSLCF